MNYVFLSRAFIKVDIINTLLISKNNHTEICKLVRRKT